VNKVCEKYNIALRAVESTCQPQRVYIDTTMAKATKKPGLYANIHAKKLRIKAGSGERMRKPGSKGAPTAKAFKESAKTAKKPKPQAQEYWKGMPPAAHSTETFREIPGILTYGPFPKYHYTKKGERVFIFYN